MRGQPYLATVRYLARFSPIAAYRDLRLFLSHRQPYELWFGILAILVTALVLFAFVKDSHFERVYKPNIVYVQQWKADRTDDQIVTQQKADQPAIDKRKAEIEARQKDRQAQFKRLDDKLKSYGFLNQDERWMAAALALAERGRGRTAPNPNVGCVIVNGGRVVGRGWTQPGGRPHAEAMALAQAGAAARGATAYVTLEPCAHDSPRGPACSNLLADAGVARVVGALVDPDPRTAGGGFARLEAAGVAVTRDALPDAARASMAGFLTRRALSRPQVTLKLATSADGRIAAPPGFDRWITGPAARAHGHVERTRHEAILIGRGTFDADTPRLDVRLPGLEDRAPRRLLLTHGTAPDGWERIGDPAEIATLEKVDHVLVEGGAATAAAFLDADLVDRILWYRAPIVYGTGRDVAADLGLYTLDPTRWQLDDTRTLGLDRLEIHSRIR